MQWSTCTRHWVVDGISVVILLLCEETHWEQLKNKEGNLQGRLTRNNGRSHGKNYFETVI